MSPDTAGMTPDFASTTLDLGELTAKYELQQELGRGGMAVVYIARDRTTGEERAIKVIHTRYLTDPDALTRFAREARFVAGLAHPRIVAIHSIESAAGVGVALVMDRIAGRTVKQLVRDTGPLPFPQVSQIMNDVAEALAFAHANGIVHRDVKPENIFIDEATGRAMLADFGIARDMHGETSLTMVGMAIGTPTYMSPEQIDGTVDGRSDLYSLGLVGWEMLTGKRPWEGDNLYKVIYRQKHDDLEPISVLRPDTPESMIVAIERLLQKNPAERWSSADEFRRYFNALATVPFRPSDAPLELLAVTDTPNEELGDDELDDEAGDAHGNVVRAMPYAPPPLGNPQWFQKEWLDDGKTGRRHPIAVDPAKRSRFFNWKTGLAAAALLVAASGTLIAARSQPKLKALLTTVMRYAPDEVPPPSALVDLSAGMAGTVAPLDRTTPTALDLASTPPLRIAAGAMHTCAVARNGAGYCWGDNGAGQVGMGATTVATAPMSVSGGVPFTAIAPGSTHTCAIARDGRAYCWGNDDHGQLGDGAGATTSGTTSRRKPSPVTGGQIFTSIASGIAHTCALSAAQRVYCWGAGTKGELGDGDRADHAAPVLVNPLKPFISVTTGWRHSCALRANGRAYCWGANDEGQLGDGTTIDRSTPYPVRTRLRFASLTAGSTHTCGIAKTGDTYCWGENRYGQLGDGELVRHVMPALVQTPEPFVTVVAGGVYTCGLTKSRDAWCWGRNNYGQLGNGTASDAPQPTKVVGNHQFMTLSAFGAHTCGTTPTDDIFCWGDNLDGQLGDGTREHRSRPVFVEKPRA